MSDAPSSDGYRNEQVDLAFDPSGSSLPPPLRPPLLNEAQLHAAVQLGFSDKCIPTGGIGNGRGRGNNSYHAPSNYGSGFGQGRGEHFPIGQYSQDCPDGGRGHYGQGGQEGLIEPLRRPDVNQIPPDVLAVMIKTGRFEEMNHMMGQDQRQQNQHYPTNPTHNVPDTQMNHNHDSRMSRNASNNPNNRNPSNQHQSHFQEQNYPGSPQQQPQDRNFSTNSPQQRPEGHYSARSPQQNQPPRHQNQRMPTGSPSVGSSQQRFGSPLNSNRATTLSPHAKVFQPSGPPPANMGEMNTQEESELAQAVAQIQMLHHNQGNSGDYSRSQSQYSSPSRNEVDSSIDNMECILSTVTDAITDLTLHPANFSRSSKTITEVLRNYLTDTDTLAVVVTLLVEQSISNPNFCYSGARLSQVLHKSGVSVGSTTFKNLLIKQCQEHFNYCVTNMEGDPNTQMRCRGLLMFFGELFVNIRIENSSGLPIPIAVFALGVIEMMQKLVKDPTYDNVKSVFQVLKLVGWDLEHSPTAKVKTEFDSLVKELSYLKCTSQQINPQTERLLQTLFDLMSKNWNREEPTEEGTSPVVSSSASNSSYGVNNVYEMPESDEEDYDETGLMLDDEPAEVQKAYEEFLKLKNKK